MVSVLWIVYKKSKIFLFYSEGPEAGAWKQGREREDWPDQGEEEGPGGEAQEEHDQDVLLVGEQKEEEKKIADKEHINTRMNMFT